jgi:hypothetical protein
LQECVATVLKAEKTYPEDDNGIFLRNLSAKLQDITLRKTITVIIELIKPLMGWVLNSNYSTTRNEKRVKFKLPLGLP